ncbi:MAG: NUDIX domain-containing protein [Ruminococcus sp.]|uniref:NUDIX hydrolase n=1 Tax=Ruminococcus sp. TaxID=41978 RepID=UPI0025FF7816|nr:NUDIX domain-containing protein [Ruminococcus sp.]MCR5540064.1 NUDIX domain-containing protein [Ruminococcus sp.]
MVQGYNCMIVLSPEGDEWLMCKRRKDPYKGLYNLVGGKIEQGEEGEHAAYRELFEETSITRDQIHLERLMTFDYPMDGCYVEVWAGQLSQPTEVSGDENDLEWLPLTEDFFDMKKYAGEGNIGHMFEILKLHPECYHIK